jgi:threonine dehydratase
LKREDQNPTGSHKDRYIAFAVSSYINDFMKTKKPEDADLINFAISSSGNAAISAIRLINSEKDIRLKLYVFISDNLEKKKLQRIIAEVPELKTCLLKYRNCDNAKITIKFSQTPLSDSIKFANKLNAILLRGSNDPYGTQGFRTISKEILAQLKETSVDSVFIPCSSGTLFAGIAQGFEKLKNSIKLIALQTSEIHPIAKSYDKNFTPENASLAEAIIDRVAHRKTEIQKIIKNTQGTAFILENKEIQHAHNILKKYNILVSYEGAMCIAGIIKARRTGLNIKRPICIITGK